MEDERLAEKEKAGFVILVVLVVTLISTYLRIKAIHNLAQELRAMADYNS